MGVCLSVPLPGPFRYAKRIGGGRRKPGAATRAARLVSAPHPYRGGRGNLYILGAPYLTVIYLVAFVTALAGHVVGFPFRRNLNGFRKVFSKVGRRYAHLARMIRSAFERV